MVSSIACCGRSPLASSLVIYRVTGACFAYFFNRQSMFFWPRSTARHFTQGILMHGITRHRITPELKRIQDDCDRIAPRQCFGRGVGRLTQAVGPQKSLDPSPSSLQSALAFDPCVDEQYSLPEYDEEAMKGVILALGQRRRCLSRGQRGHCLSLPPVHDTRGIPLAA
jgi:hypothetical protein